MSHRSDLSGRIALVTGGGSGIGRATVLGLADAGADVVVLDIDRIEGRASAALAEERGGRAAFVEADLSDISKLPNAVEEASVALGPIDILVNNAGLHTKQRLIDADHLTWQRVIDVNLTAPWRLSQLVATRLVNRVAQGWIVNVSSSAAFRARDAGGAYGVAKAGLCGLTRVMAGECAAHGINVNAVAPGITATGMALSGVGGGDSLQQAVSSGVWENLFHRVSAPEDVANAIVFLCTPGSRQITGQIIHTSAGNVV